MESSAGDSVVQRRLGHRRSQAVCISPGSFNPVAPKDLALCPKPAKMPEGKPKLPKPGPAKLTKNSDVDEWLKAAFNNQYLPEQTMKKLCEICKEYLMEGW